MKQRQKKFCQVFVLILTIFALIFIITKSEHLVFLNKNTQSNRNSIFINSEKSFRDKIIDRYQNEIPQEWGISITGVKTKLATDKKAIALTFDACGGQNGNGYDKELIEYLTQEQIPATLFISGKWIDANSEIFKALSLNPLFEIANHGLNHKPCSVNGKSAYGIKGTESVSEVFDEIDENAGKIEEITGKRPKFYRSGTDYYDELCVAIAKDLEYEVVSFSVNGDGGAKYSVNQVKNSLLNVKPDSIVLFHMNHPEGNTKEGLERAMFELKAEGYSFVRLSDYELK